MFHVQYSLKYYSMFIFIYNYNVWFNGWIGMYLVDSLLCIWMEKMCLEKRRKIKLMWNEQRFAAITAAAADATVDNNGNYDDERH